MTSWFTVILEQILALEQQLINRDKAIKAELDQVLALAQQNETNIQALTVLAQQNADGIQQILRMLTPPVPTKFTATITTP